MNNEWRYNNATDELEHEYRLPVVDRIFENTESGVLVIRWKDGTVTKSRVCDGDTYDFKTAVALCFMKKATYDFDDLCTSLHEKKTTRTDKVGRLEQELNALTDEINKRDAELDKLTDKFTNIYKALEDAKAHRSHKK